MHPKSRSATSCPLWTIYAAVFFCLLATSTALECFQCDSHKTAASNVKDPECVDEFNVTIKADRLGVCSNATDRYPMRCMKIITYTTDTNREVVNSRTTRLCAESEYEDKCWHQTSGDGGSYTCYCSEDGCNTAAHTSVSVWTAVQLLGSVVAAWTLHH